MSKHDDLVKLTIVADDSTGMYHVGEIDYGICFGVSQWLKDDARRAEAVKMLRWLADRLEAKERPFSVSLDTHRPPDQREHMNDIANGREPAASIGGADCGRGSDPLPSAVGVRQTAGAPDLLPRWLALGSGMFCTRHGDPAGCPRCAAEAAARAMQQRCARIANEYASHLVTAVIIAREIRALDPAAVAKEGA